MTGQDKNITNEEAHTANSTYPKGGVSCFADTFARAESSVLQMKFSGKNPALRVAANRYRKPYDDTANIKLTDMIRIFFDDLTNRLTARTTSQRNEVLFFANPHFLFFNFNATAHCTHLPLLACTQSQPKSKVKRVQSPTHNKQFIL